MNSCYIKELKRYNLSELREIFKVDAIVLRKILNKLKLLGILKLVDKDSKQYELSEILQKDDVLDIIAEFNDNDFLYVFQYVGIVMIENRILIFYPKYINNTSPVENLRIIQKALIKYNQKEEIINLYNGLDEDKSFNLLAVILFLLDDYHRYGLYSNISEYIESNGEGNILRNKTIDENYAIIQNNMPIYVNIYTKKFKNNDLDFITRLHKCILAKCSKILEETELLNIFDDILPVYLTDETLDDLGDLDYILYKIDAEINAQYNTHKQILLKTIYSFLLNTSSTKALNSFSLFGTSSFNLLWEEACKVVLDNKLNIQLKKLELPLKKDNYYDNYFNSGKALKDIIEKPIWKLDDFTRNYKTETYIPDLITIDKDIFYILDAKYYCLEVTRDNRLINNPGIESLTKQYMYNLAYKKFVSCFSFKKIYNSFLFPNEKEKSFHVGEVELQICSSLGLPPINLESLSANRIFSSYIKNEHLSLDDLLISQ